MAFKLVIGNTVRVPVAFTLNDGKGDKTFSFSLTCDRRTQDEIKSAIDANGPVVDFLSGVVCGWSGQTLVVDEDGKPVEFSADALAVLLSVTGVPTVIYTAYLKEVGAKAKN